MILFLAQAPEYSHHLWDRANDKGDTYAVTWILAWEAHALLQSGVSMWDAPVLYPARNALAFVEVMFGNLWITVPVQWITDNPIFATNMLVLTSFLLCMYFTYFFVRDVGGTYWAGVMAGALFSFNPYRWGQIPHAQLLPFYWAPIALLFTNRFLRSQKALHFIFMIACICAQYYASIYLGVILLTMLTIFFLLHFFFELRGMERRRYFNFRSLKLLVAGGVLATAILTPLGLPYYKTASEWHFLKTMNNAIFHSAEPSGFFFPWNFKNYDWLASLFPDKTLTMEAAVFLGIAPWVLGAYAMAKALSRRSDFSQDQKRLIIRLGWTSLILATLVLGPYLVWSRQRVNLPMPYQIVYHLIPGALGVRAPARFIQATLLCLSIMGGLAFDTIRRLRIGSKRSLQAALLFMFGVLLWLDYSPKENPGVTVYLPSEFPPVYAYLAEKNNGPVLEIPAGLPVYESDYRYLYYQTKHWRPELGGVASAYPPAWLYLRSFLTGFPSKRCLEHIGLSEAQTLVVHKDHLSEEEKTAWELADLLPRGFRYVGVMGDAMVWERQNCPFRLSPKLTVKQVIAAKNGKLFLHLLPG